MSKPLGVQQMRSLLLGAYHAGLKVETLHCGLVSWRVLQQDTETLAHMKESLSNLKNPRLEFSTGSIDYDDDSDYSGTAFGNGTVFLMARASISQTPRLRSTTTSKTYKFGFQPIRDPPAVSSQRHSSPSIAGPPSRLPKFQTINTTDDDLVSFCSRHASTLRSLPST